MKTLFACFILILSQGFITCDEEYDYDNEDYDDEDDMMMIMMKMI